MEGTKKHSFEELGELSEKHSEKITLKWSIHKLSCSATGWPSETSRIAAYRRSCASYSASDPTDTSSNTAADSWKHTAYQV